MSCRAEGTAGCTVAELRSMLDRRELSARELAVDSLDRLESVARPLNAVVDTTRDRALAAAESADIARARDDRRPLLGIPFGVKDVIDVAGTPTRCGSRALPPEPASADAVVVNRLDSAGGVVVAKLATAELIGLATHDPTTSAAGPALNPWDRGRWAGGSSGGSAAAVAVGAIPFALGTETAGSIGAPAAWCGVTGFRPTAGSVSTTGVAPLSPTLDKVGVLARSADDCSIVLDALVPTTRRPTPPARVERPVVGHATVDFDAAPAAMRSAHAEALGVIARAGRLVESAALPGDLDYRAVLDVIMQAEAWNSFDVVRTTGRVQHIGDAHARAFVGGDAPDPQRYREAIETRRSIVAAVDEVFDAVDLIVTTNFALPWPIHPIGRAWAPIPIGGGNTAMVWASNLAGLPAVSIPVGVADGLPVSLQLVGARGSDHELIAFACAVQKETQWHRQLPPMEDPT